MILGDLRKQLTKDLIEDIGEVINKYQKKYPWYYLLVHSLWEGNHLKSRIVILSPEYLAKHKLDSAKMEKLAARLSYYDSLLFYINNKKEQFELLNALPMIMPVYDGLLSEEVSSLVAKSAENINKHILN